MTIIVFLMILAAVDLFVGVSNDAVNFLNSAVGSRVAPLNHVLVVAAAGVLIGATFSSGMMEIARSGMFYPEKFSFEQIAFIYSVPWVCMSVLVPLPHCLDDCGFVIFPEVW